MSFRDLLSLSGLNTLTFVDSFAKATCTSFAISQMGRTLYIDLDAMFSSYVSAGLIEPKSAIKADVLLPSKGRFLQFFQMAIDMASLEKYSLIVFDSLNSFYNMYEVSPYQTGKVNQMLCTVVMLLVRFGVDAGIPVLATSMLRYRKDKGWVQSPAARRLIEHNSITVLSAERQPDLAKGLSKEEENTVVYVKKHPSIPEGAQIRCDGVSIALR